MEASVTNKFSKYCSALSALVLLTACGKPGNEVETTSNPTRPVSYIELTSSKPGKPYRVAGAVGSWKQEMLGFEVGGVVDYVVEPGTLINARIDNILAGTAQNATVLASLGNQRLQLRRSEAQASMSSIRAEFERAKKELERQTRLLEDGAGAQGFVDTANARYESARAELSRAREAYQRTDIDVSDSELYSPFDGQVSKVHVIPGGYVERGQPVLTVQMMDPLKIEVAVSPKKDREINFNDLFDVYVDGHDEPLQGWVWNKDAVADAATRTFMVTLLVRNKLLDSNSVATGKAGAIPTSALWNLEAERANAKPPYFVNSKSLHQDAEGQFVWRAVGISTDDRERTFDKAFKVEKVRVTVGERTQRFLQLMTYRELVDIGQLAPEQDLLTDQLPADAKDGDIVYLDRKRWLLRPGQLVDVDLQESNTRPGYYAPAGAIVRDVNGHHIFVVTKDDEGIEKARQIKVKPGRSIGSVQEILPLDIPQFEHAERLIVDGAQYVRDGEIINAFSKAGGIR